jgi:hypothetical protein
MLVIVPIWLCLLIWLVWYPSRRQHRYEAAKAAAARHELQMVAAMPNATREEYWQRKAAGCDDLGRVKPPAKLPMLLWGSLSRPRSFGYSRGFRAICFSADPALVRDSTPDSSLAVSEYPATPGNGVARADGRFIPRITFPPRSAPPIALAWGRTVPPALGSPVAYWPWRTLAGLTERLPTRTENLRVPLQRSDRDPATAPHYAASLNAPGAARSPRLRSVGCWANSRYRQ